jgi:hypothetical protein
VAPGLFALLLFATPAASKFELQWHAPEGCPDRSQALAAVALQLDRSVGAPSDPSVRADVTIEQREGSWRAQLELVVDGTGGTRELHGESCDTLASAVAFVVASTIDPNVTLRETNFATLPNAYELWLARQSPRLRDPLPLRVDASMMTHTTRLAPPSRSPRLRVAIGASAVLAVGPLPGVAGGILGTLALLHRRFRVELGTTFLPAKTARFDAQPDAGGELRLVAADLRACPRWQWQSLGLDACAGLEAGVLHGRGFGIDEPATTRQPWLAAMLGPRLSYAPIRWLAIGLGAELLVPIVRPTFGVDNVGRLHRPLPAGFLGTLGLEGRLQARRAVRTNR